MHLKSLLPVLAGLLLLAADGSLDGPTRIDAAGVPNLIRLSDHIYQGAMPQGDAGFASLEKLGVKTVITVDGARPDLEDAHKHGIRYVHLPMSYDGMTREQALRVAKAVRDLAGPFDFVFFDGDRVTAPQLVTAGPYAHTRNPLYLGNLITAVGFTVAFGGALPPRRRTLLAALGIGTMLAVYAAIVPHEEAFLLETFGDDYADYCARVKYRLMPGIW